jgi:hypothetical protein
MASAVEGDLNAVVGEPFAQKPLADPSRRQ